MNILWIVNTIFPFPAKKLNIKEIVFGGWLNSLLNSIKEKKEIKKIAVVTVYNGNEIKKFEEKKIIYYLIPCKNMNLYDDNMKRYWDFIVTDFKPDICHIHGTEYPHSLSFLRNDFNLKTCVSIQGLVSIYGKKETYNAGINWLDLLKSITLRDIVKKDLLITQYKKFIKKGMYEKEILQRSDLIIGRTSWDNAYAFDITNENKYEKCNETLRSAFYQNEWNIEKIERNSIFVSQATYPIKGFHKVIEMARILLKKYPNIKIYVAGPNITKNNYSFKEKLKLTGYGKYLLKLIKKNKLENNIIFLGLLTEKELCERLLKSNVFLQAASIENSPNSLGEAMLLGLPCVASYVGGTADMLLDKKEGFLYPFGDVAMMAKYIMDIFENDKLAIEFGNNAKKHAKITHSVEENSKKMLEIYNKLLK